MIVSMTSLNFNLSFQILCRMPEWSKSRVVFVTTVSLLLCVVAQMELGDSPTHINVWMTVKSFIIVVRIYSVNPDKLLGDPHSLNGLTLSTVSVQQERAARRELDGDGERAAVLAAEMEIHKLSSNIFRYVSPFFIGSISIL